MNEYYIKTDREEVRIPRIHGESDSAFEHRIVACIHKLQEEGYILGERGYSSDPVQDRSPEPVGGESSEGDSSSVPEQPVGEFREHEAESGVVGEHVEG